jgi:hypothetical protein
MMSTSPSTRPEPDHEAAVGRLAFDRIPNWENKVVVTVALDEIDEYLEAAARQVKRMEASFATDEAEERRTGHFEMHHITEIAIDADFYFACWHRIRHMIRLLEKRSGLNTPAAILAAHGEELDRCANARDRIVHLDTRLPGRRHEHETGGGDGIWWFGSVVYPFRMFQIGRDRYDLSERSLLRLNAIVAELMAELRTELAAMPVTEEDEDSPERELG